MKSEITETKGSRVTIKIALEPGEWQRYVQEAVKQVAAGIKVPGFRPGKAPAEVVINQAGEARIVSEATEAAINKFYLLALKEHQILPVVAPKIAVEKVGLDTPLVFTAEVVTLPEVKLGDYKNIKVEAKPIEADPARVEGVLKNIQRQQAKFNPVERAIKQGDWVEIDFDGKIDGKPFAGGQSKNHPLVVGDGVFLPDFETALVGMQPGETKTFPVTFPLDYHKSEFANKTAEFTVTVHKVKEVTLPELNDELAQAAGDFKTLADLQADISKFLQEDLEKQELDRQKEEAINQLIKLTDIDLPSELVEQEIDSMVHDLEHQLEHQQMNLEDYLKKADMTATKLRAEWKETAIKRVVAGLALNAFRKAEGIDATAADVEKEIDRLKTMYPQEADKITEKYKHDFERDRLKTLLSGQMAIDRLWAIAIGK